jgi:trans-aconitate 2-methyltransferase
MSRDIWSPQQYRAYSSHRGRPIFELLARMDIDAPRFVVDLGCGPGERTMDLATRWPDALIEGIDSSEQMIAEARRLPVRAENDAEGDGATIRGRVRFEVGDLATWTPERPVDVIFSNAALQWVPGHERLLPCWVKALAPGGRLAFSMPGNFDEPSHAILRELSGSPRWRHRLAGAVRHNVVGRPADYFSQLTALGCDVDAWETTYLQVLPGEDPVLEWMTGTALRPVLDLLTDGERETFMTELAAQLRAAYPRREFGTIFPFRRIFVVAGVP